MLLIPILGYASGVLQHKNFSFPTDQTLYDIYPWTFTYYHTATMNTPLVKVLRFTGFKRWPEDLNSVELAYTLPPDNFLRRFFSPVVGIVEIVGNVTIRNGYKEQTVYEFDPHFMFRWANFPWNRYVYTSLAIGEGLSYATSIPAVELRNSRGNECSKRLLNFLAFEATFAFPQFPQLQLIARVHHRSGAYGLYGAGNSGSNDIGLGISYLF